jgi:hypothetical protein
VEVVQGQKSTTDVIGGVQIGAIVVRIARHNRVSFTTAVSRNGTKPPRQCIMDAFGCTSCEAVGAHDARVKSRDHSETEPPEETRGNADR